MNCKPGDLAYIVGSSDGYGLGFVVEVLFACPAGEWADPSIPEWTCRSRSPVRTQDYVTDAIEYCTEFDAPDAWLRPITGLPIDEDVTDDLEIPA